MYNDKVNRSGGRYARYSGHTPIAGNAKREPIGAGWWLFAALLAAYFIWQFSR